MNSIVASAHCAYHPARVAQSYDDKSRWDIRQLHRIVDREIERLGELDVGRGVAERQHAERLWGLVAQGAFGSPTPIIESRVTSAARRSSSQPSEPGGRIGSTM